MMAAQRGTATTFSRSARRPLPQDPDPAGNRGRQIGN